MCPDFNGVTHFSGVLESSFFTSSFRWALDVPANEHENYFVHSIDFGRPRLDVLLVDLSVRVETKLGALSSLVKQYSPISFSFANQRQKLFSSAMSQP